MPYFFAFILFFAPWIQANECEHSFLKDQNQDQTQNLFKAVEQLDRAQVEQALQKGADINAKGLGGATPFLWAVDRARNTVTKTEDIQNIRKFLMFLIEKGADKNARDKDGFNAVHIASLWDSPMLTFLIEEQKISPTVLTNNKENALDVAISSKNWGVVRKLKVKNIVANKFLHRLMFF